MNSRELDTKLKEVAPYTGAGIEQCNNDLSIATHRCLVIIAQSLIEIVRHAERREAQASASESSVGAQPAVPASTSAGFDVDGFRNPRTAQPAVPASTSAGPRHAVPASTTQKGAPPCNAILRTRYHEHIASTTQKGAPPCNA